MESKRDFYRQTKVGTEIKDIVTVKTAVGFKVRVAKVELFSSATLFVEKYDENDRVIETTVVTLSGEDYLNWGGDDNYVMAYASEAIGMPPSKEWYDEQQKKLDEEKKKAEELQKA
jgi:hypothetical protein